MGPRSYSSGTEKALFQLSRGSCYYPGCDVPVVVFLDPVTPVVNVHISHIRGALPKSARYDETMTDEERSSFGNLLLLCKPHHDLVDRIRPEDHPPPLLEEWKHAREGADFEPLSEVDIPTDAVLGNLIESIIQQLGPQRSVEVELRGGSLVNEVVAMVPLHDWKALLALNPELGRDLVLAVTVRNTGTLQVFVDAVGVVHVAEHRGRKGVELTLAQRNDFPSLNPRLPRALAVGESMTWIVKLRTAQLVTERLENSPLRVTGLRADVQLGTGETISSHAHEVSLLPA